MKGCGLLLCFYLLFQIQPTCYITLHQIGLLLALCSARRLLCGVGLCRLGDLWTTSSCWSNEVRRATWSLFSRPVPSSPGSMLSLFLMADHRSTVSPLDRLSDEYPESELLSPSALPILGTRGCWSSALVSPRLAFSLLVLRVLVIVSMLSLHLKITAPGRS